MRGGGEQPTVELYVDPGALNSSRGERPRLAFDRPLDGVWASDDFGVVVLVEVGNGA